MIKFQLYLVLSNRPVYAVEYISTAWFRFTANNTKLRYDMRHLVLFCQEMLCNNGGCEVCFGSYKLPITSLFMARHSVSTLFLN